MLPSNKSLDEIISLTKKYMRNNKNSSKIYKIVYNNEEIHKFIAFERNNKVYWFEYFIRRRASCGFRIKKRIGNN